MLNITKTKLKKSVNKDFSNLKSFFKATNKLKNYFYFKDLVTEILRLIEFIDFRREAAKLVT